MAKIKRKFLKKKKGTTLTPPPGGRLHIVCVPVNPARQWQEAVIAAGPNTPSDYNVWKVGGQYSSIAAEVQDDEIILLNFGPNNGSWDRAIAWAEQNKLVRTAPRQVFALGEHCPTLHHELGMNPICVVATTECTFKGRRRACNVWWDDAKRWVNLSGVSHCGGAGDWFAFVRK